MAVDPQSPWRVTTPCGTICETNTVCDRVEKIKASNDKEWLNRVVGWRDHGQQSSVTDAAVRRLRKLGRGARK